VAGLIVTGAISLPAVAEEPKSAAPAAAGPKRASGLARAEASAPAQDPRDQRIDELNQIVEELRKRVEELEQRAAAPAPAPAPPPAGVVSPAPAPAAEPAPEPAAPRAAAPGGATLLPNISAIGNVIFRGSDSKRTPGRSRFSLQEAEFALQDRVAPNLRADFFVAAEKGEDSAWGAAVEEGYLTWATPLGIRNLSARFGRVRTPFGKLNALHPHLRRTVDQPSVLTALLGPDGLGSDGSVLQYLLPFKGLFANLELGRWQTVPGTEDGLGFGGDNRNAWSGRLWIGKEVGADRELELGFSHYRGRGQQLDTDPIQRRTVQGLDLTFRSFPSAYRRFTLQAEALQHRVAGGESRRGWYVDAALRTNQYWELGARADRTAYPFPIDGHESAFSAYLTRYLTEQTSLRLQLKHGRRPEDGTFNELFVQFLFGFGPHSHLLQ
jgi:hypothetical protein